jgi:two-component system chemotaxis sensor kinase CheA
VRYPWVFKYSKESADISWVDELTKEFLSESRDGLDRMERCLTDLETRPGDRELVDEIFRAVHTIKGATGFLGFGRLEALAHAGESLLGALRGGKLAVSPDLISGLLELLDSLRDVLRLVEMTGGEGQRETDEDFATIAHLMELMDKGMVSAELGRIVALAANGPLGSNQGAERDRTDLQVRGADAAERRVALQAVEKTVRVDVDVLNRMMNLVGELVLTRNQMLRATEDRTSFDVVARRLDAVTADLRETVMRARLQPVGHLFGKFPRLVRDLANLCGKQVRVEVEGQDTGLDKSLLEAIRDPLTHAIRNAIGHGIESPRERKADGKDPEGVIRLRALQHNGSVVIEVEDDGAGISAKRVAAKAIAGGLVTPEQAAAMTEQERVELVFAAGFSTAEEVTSVSGRGVGLDVVRENVHQAGGRVELESREGLGVTLRITLPLTLAIVPVLVVRSAGQSFALPQSALAELIAISPQETVNKLKRIGPAEVYCMRDQFIPVLRLNWLLQLDKQQEDRHRDVQLAVLETEGCRFGLLVDDLVAPEEIVVKPISAILRQSAFSGAAVLGCGELAMVLDLAALRKAAGVRRDANRRELSPPPKTTANVERPPVLVYEIETRHGGRSATERHAMPLSLIERIVTVDRSSIDSIGDCLVLQQGGTLLEVYDEGNLLASTAGEPVTVLVCVIKGRKLAVIVDRVLEVCEGATAKAGEREQIGLVNERLAIVENDFDCFSVEVA